MTRSGPRGRERRSPPPPIAPRSRSTHSSMPRFRSASSGSRISKRSSPRRTSCDFHFRGKWPSSPGSVSSGIGGEAAGADRPCRTSTSARTRRSQAWCCSRAMRRDTVRTSRVSRSSRRDLGAVARVGVALIAAASIARGRGSGCSGAHTARPLPGSYRARAVRCALPGAIRSEIGFARSRAAADTGSSPRTALAVIALDLYPRLRGSECSQSASRVRRPVTSERGWSSIMWW